MSQVCIVSYFSSASHGVGGVRAKYWFKNLPKLSSGKYQTHFLTGTHPEETNARIHYIKPLFQIKFDQGLGWIIPLWKCLMKNADQYDIFIFTCGPFLQLLLIPWLKLFFRKKIIIDYRDPFSINPVFPDSRIKTWIKKLIEIFVNLAADRLVTVNAFCKELLIYPPGTPVSIIDNGYDETITQATLTPDTKVSFLYPGEFSIGREPGEFLKALEAFNLHLTHIGKTKFETDSPSYHYAGKKNYSESLGYIESSDYCVLFSSGHPFESTTKIFDYLRFNKRILIIYNEYFSYGALRDITAGNSQVIWIKNDRAEIQSVLSSLTTAFTKNQELNPESYSRKEKCKQLIALLDQF